MADNKKNDKDKKKETKIIVYSGNDTSFFETIKNRFMTSYPEMDFDFQIHFNEVKGNHQKVFLDIFTQYPFIIYVDFSVETEEQMLLSKLLSREHRVHNTPLVGLVDGEELLTKVSASGCDFLHIKCGEHHDVVYDPCVLCMGKALKSPQYALAKIKKSTLLHDELRLGYISEGFIHAEGNFNISEGDEIEIESSISKEINESKKFIVKSINDTNLYYDYSYGYDLNFTYLDPPVVKEEEQDDALGVEDEQKREKDALKAQTRRKENMAEYEELLKRIKVRNTKWLALEASNSSPKSTKILILDKKLDILKGESKALDSYPYSIRVNSQQSNEMYEITRIRPNVIAFRFVIDMCLEAEGYTMEQYENDPELTMEEKEKCKALIDQSETDSLDTLSDIVTKIKELENYDPIVIVFNCKKYTSKSFQESFQFQYIMTYDEDIRVSLILDIANLFETKNKNVLDKKIKDKIASLKKKDPIKYSRLQESDFREKKYFISKRNALSFMRTSFDIELETMTESELTFLSAKELKLISYKLDFPITMGIRIIPINGLEFEIEGDFRRYRALIHSVDENGKKDIRKYVNQTFFKDLDEKREEEHKAFNDLNNKVMQDKIDAEEAAEAEATAEANKDDKDDED